MDAIITGEITIHCQDPLKIPVLRQAITENTFTNPAYVEAIRTGRSTHVIPKTITTYRCTPGSIFFPRGYGSRLHALAQSMKTQITWSDNRVLMPAAYPSQLIGLTLRHYQSRANTAALETTQGVIVAPTASGKTATGLDLIRQRSQRAAVLVHAQPLARQWRKVIKERLGLDAGLIGDGNWIEGREITVAIIQTLYARQDAARLFADKIGLLLLDECHHAAAETFAQVIGMFPGKFRYGFTATPKRGDGLQTVINRLMGDVIATIHPDEVQEVGGIVQAKVETVDTGCRFAHIDPQKKTAWTDLLKALVANRERNLSIANIAVSLARSRQTLVLTDRVEHAEALSALIPGSLLVHGKLPAKEREKRMAELATARIVVGTKGLLGEGLDCSVWSALILTSPISGATPLLQAVGRVIRPAPGKRDGLVVDMVDAHPFALGAWKKRATIYRQRQWPISRRQLWEN